jgi:hypothetical protein
MKAMLTVLLIGVAVAVAMALSPAESVRANTPLVALATGVLLLAYWVIASDHAPAHHDAGTYKKAA